MKSLRFGTLGYGAANLGNLSRELTEDDSWEILEGAWALGVRYFDTAPHYGLGLSERRLGAFLQTKPRSEFVVSTKVGRLLRPGGGIGEEQDSSFLVRSRQRRVWDPSESGVRASLNDSLDRLGLDSVDILYLHDPEQEDLQRSLALGLGALADMREEGLVSAIGVGSMSTSALLAAAQSEIVDLLMVAGRYTLLEQPVFPEVLDACTNNSIGIVNASVFNSGLLAQARPMSTARYEYGNAPAAVVQKAQLLAEICGSFNVELPTAALHFSSRDARVRSTVVGANTVAQLRDSVSRMGATVPSELWECLRQAGLIPE
jgi:D-threo-aldose 1-dehydrogenase